MFKIKVLTVFLSFLLVPLMSKCGEGIEEPCSDYTNYTSIDNLGKITPLKVSYAQGETVKFKFSLDSKISLINKDIDIYQTTKASPGFLAINLTEFLKGNAVTYVKGNLVSENLYNVVYNSITDAYELEIDVILNRKGIYSFTSYANFEERRSQEGVCVYASIGTQIEGDTDDDDRIEFIVQ